MSDYETKLCGGQSCGCAGNECSGEKESGTIGTERTCGGDTGGNCPGVSSVCGCPESDCTGQDQGTDCGGCHGQCQSTGCPGRTTNGCGGCCPHAAGNEFEWDYDDTVLVFSSDMLEESP